MAAAIILGAFGAHALQSKLTTEQILSFETGVRYQIYHALAFLIIAFNCDKLQAKFCRLAVKIMLIGLACFSGSIYLFTVGHLTGNSISSLLWWVTPLGGLMLISSWLVLIKARITLNQ